MSVETKPDTGDSGDTGDPGAEPEATAARTGRGPSTRATRATNQDSGAPGRWARLLARVALALAAGLALALAFPPFGWSWLAPVAPAAATWLILGVRARTGALVGFVFGLGFFGLLLKWVALTGADGWAAVVVIESLFLAVWGAASAVVARHRLWPVWVSALWIAVEFARSRVPLGGFPWGELPGALSSTPMASLAWLGGLSFASFATVLAGNLLLWTVVRRRRRTRNRAGAVLVAGALLLGGAALPLPSMDDPTKHGSDTVAIIQGMVPGRGVDFLGEPRAVTYNHLEATRQLMEGVDSGRYHQPDWVLWPENSTDIDPTEDQMAHDMVQTAAERAGVPILVGAIMDGPVRPDIYRQTTGIVWDPETGPGEIYAKRHPVPFGEYIPFREFLLPLIDRLQMVGRDTYPGDEPGNMTIAGTDIGLVICFEVAYDGIVADVARSERNSIFVVQSNNATWQGLGMAEQQFAITRMRAIEYGKATLVATPSGISGVIGPDGEVLHQSKESVRDIHVAEVPKRTERTPAAVLGPAPELALVALGAGALLVLGRHGAVARLRRVPARLLRRRGRAAG